MSDANPIAAPSRTQSVFRTGAGEIDNKLGGGIPAGSLTLVEGESDAGKSVLLQHFAYGAMMERQKVAYYSTENKVNGMVRQMESLGLDISDSFLLGEFHIFHMDTSQASGTAAQLCDGLLGHIASLPSDVSLVIVDSITNLVTHLTGASANRDGTALAQTQDMAIMDFFGRCKSLCDRGRTIFIAAHNYAFEEKMLIRVRSLCDAHFRLKVKQVGEKLVKSLEVAKVHRAERTTGNIVSFEVEPALGIKMIPISHAKA